jgi:polysaccharide biosynthesis protein PslH
MDSFEKEIRIEKEQVLMNILQICNKSPYPPKEGGPIAMYNLAEGLIMAGHNLDILAISTNKYSVDINELPKDYREKTSFSTVYIDTTVRISNALQNLFSSRSYHAVRFDSEEMHKKLAEILQKKKFDIIQLETIYLGPYIQTIQKYSDAPIVLRTHNIEHLIWQRIAASEKNPLKKYYLYYLARKLRKYEEHIFNIVNGIACISEIDCGFIKKSGITTPTETVPFGMVIPESINMRVRSGNLTLFFIGSMDWLPNLEGIKWFLDYCMPLLAQKFPENRILLAGRNMPSWVYTYKFPNFKVIGEVDNAIDFIDSNDIMFVPLFSGSGVRIKILEGMALGKVIISTTTGAEGIHYIDEENILIADTPDQFIEKFMYCIENSQGCQRIGTSARNLIKENHDILKTTKILVEFYKFLLNINR